MMKNLEALLSQEEPVAKLKKIALIDKLQITKYAYEKAFAYARAACDVHRSSIECGGYLVAPKGTEGRIVTDSFLARNQHVESGLYTLEAHDVLKARDELDEQGFRVLGWWHSHGYMSTFFSSTDDRGQMTMLNGIAPMNYVTEVAEQELGNLEVNREGDVTVIFDRNRPSRKYHIEAAGDLHVAHMRITQEKRVGFAYGLVVNAKKGRHPYVEIATRDMCGTCDSAIDKSIKSTVDVIKGENFVIDEEALRKEVRDRIHFPKKFLGFSLGSLGYGPSFDDQDFGFPSRWSRPGIYNSDYPVIGRGYSSQLDLFRNGDRSNHGSE